MLTATITIDNVDYRLESSELSYGTRVFREEVDEMGTPFLFFGTFRLDHEEEFMSLEDQMREQLRICDSHKELKIDLELNAELDYEDYED